MRRREFIALLGATTCPLATRAQQAATVARIGMMLPVSPAAAMPYIEVFRQALRERGYVEGQNIAIEYRYAEGKFEPYSEFAAELVRLNVDIIVTWGTAAAQAAKRATSMIPIVMAAATDPVASGLVASLARPGGNVTGVTSGSWELSGKGVELLGELVPGLDRVAVVWNPDSPNIARMRRQVQGAARTLKLKVQPLEVRDPGGLESAFAALRREDANAIFVFHDFLVFEHRNRVVDLVARSGLPAMYERREYVEAGGLMAYGLDFRDNFRRVASHVEKILKGARPADLPVEDPTKFELIINLTAAKALGLTIPHLLLLRADEVIE
jgi:putative ABC transport system substrate-binding protein